MVNLLRWSPTDATERLLGEYLVPDPSPWSTVATAASAALPGSLGLMLWTAATVNQRRATWFGARLEWTPGHQLRSFACSHHGQRSQAPDAMACRPTVRVRSHVEQVTTQPVPSAARVGSGDSYSGFGRRLISISTTGFLRSLWAGYDEGRPMTGAPHRWRQCNEPCPRVYPMG
ncbi:hypothetical protein NITHO_3110003 [Nitrolancea hollandica Lb]|uniref:Uncharacterized protein n=1 Tax=Nitrolancea hollandica Lb TaxID=1129897 RepID=I4EHG8_9BACT|nr:hypothetical protein NITHO_3110003 [Nitrolancea hollandica Lb]